jgi:hypothetical protein
VTLEEFQFPDEDLPAAVLRELRRADDLANARAYTEAALRLGRAVEAALYASGRAFNIRLENRSITSLAGVQDKVQEIQSILVDNRDTRSVRLLAEVSSMVATCIAELVENEDLRIGMIDPKPRSVVTIFETLVRKTKNQNVNRRLKENGPFLESIMRRRNDAAHADVQGNLREFTEEEYAKLRVDMGQFLDELLRIEVEIRAAATYSVRKPSTAARSG